MLPNQELMMGIIPKNIAHASVALSTDIYDHLTPKVMENAAQTIIGRLFGE